jgi:peptidoglycan/LPS O-acetylase OafA/YrhL
VGNWALTYQWVAGSMGMIGHTWTLAVEEQFYALWPITLLLVLRSTRRYERVAIALLVSSLVEAGVRAYLVVSASGTGISGAFKLLAGYYSTIGHSDGLLMGAALAFWLATDRQVTARARANLVHGGGVALFVLMATIPAISNLPAEGLRVIINAATACMILGIVTGGGGIGCTILSRRPVVYIGRISYSLYLWHYPLFIAIGSIPFFAQYHGWYWAAKLTVPFVVAAASYHFIEQPFLRMGRTNTDLSAKIAAHVASGVR